MKRRADLASLLAIFALALVARSLGSAIVFLDDGGVVFTAGDPWYHVRRALFSFANFPDYLRFDPCLAYPHGAPVPWPPLWDLALAAGGLLAGGTHRSFELAAAWLPVLVGAAAVFPVHAIGRRLSGPGLGLGAAAIYALFPAAVDFSRVGYADHHAAVAFLGAGLLALYVAILDRRTSGWRLVRAAAWLALTRAAMLLVWPGVLLYMAPGELAIALAAIVPGRRDRLAALATSAVASLAIVAPFVLHAALPLGGPFSATELSWLHVALLAAMALVLGAVGLAMEGGLVSRAPTRVGVAVASGVALLALALLLVPGLAAGLGSALGFVISGTDGIGGSTLELRPFLSPPRGTVLSGAIRRMGLFVFLVPVVPLAFLSLRKDPEIGAAAWLLASWSALFAALTAAHMRYMNDFAAAGCVGFALTLGIARRWLAAHVGAPIATAAVIAAGVAAIAPAIVLYHLPYWSIDRDDLPGDRALYTAAGTEMRFAQTVRARTPATPGCGPRAGHPTYGILAHPTIGHALHYVAERATPGDAFGPYVGAETFDEMRRFFATSSEDEALAIARKLDTPYVITAHDLGPAPDSLLYRLHVADGGAAGSAPHWGRFRLLEEGPEGGRSVVREFGIRTENAVPFKLYEIVEGAVLEAHAAPGQVVRARLAIRTPLRLFGWEAIGIADEEGVARLRVPYPTEGDGPVRAEGRYRVHVGERTVQVDVRDEQVRSGAVVPVGG